MAINTVPLLDLKAQNNYLKKDALKVLKEIISNTSFTRGPYVENFENEFAKYIGVKYAVGVSSGTGGLQLALAALDVGKGDEVILPVNTFISDVYAVLYLSAKPVFADIDPDTFNIAVSEIVNKITKKTKVIMPTHLYGQPAGMDKILKIAKDHNLKIIEDACQAHGATYKTKRVGSIGNMGVFSFYPTKNLGAWGDAGGITTNSKKLATDLKVLREYGESKRYYYEKIGYLSRLDQIQAAILSIKLKKLDAANKQRQKKAVYYNKIFGSEVKQISTPFVLKDSAHVYYQYVIKTPRRDQLVNYLNKHSVQSGIYFPVPLHLQKSLKGLGYKKGDFKIAEKTCQEILSLPIFPELTQNSQDYIINLVKRFFKN